MAQLAHANKYDKNTNREVKVIALPLTRFEEKLSKNTCKLNSRGAKEVNKNISQGNNFAEFQYRVFSTCLPKYVLVYTPKDMQSWKCLSKIQTWGEKL